MSPIEVYTGPMFSSKSESIVNPAKKRLLAQQAQGVDFLAFNNWIDNRYGENVISSHNGESIPAIALKQSLDLLPILFNCPEDITQLDSSCIKPEYLSLQVIYLDEAQFFDVKLPDVLRLIDLLFRQHPQRKEPLIIHVAGLDCDFRGEPFGPMPRLLVFADEVHKLKAICLKCKRETATRTQRLILNEPANWNDPIILVDGKDSYTARCPEHHEVPGKPLFKNDQVG